MPSAGRLASIVMARTLWRHGVGAFVAALMTAPISRLLDAAASAAIDPAGTTSEPRARLLGVHLEGPALSPVRSGGHDPTALIPPSAVLRTLLDDPGAWTNVRIVTLAPELDGGPELIDGLTRAGIVASIGHTNATAEVISAAYARGARSTTHLFNGMPPLHHREPGPVGRRPGVRALHRAHRRRGPRGPAVAGAGRAGHRGGAADPRLRRHRASRAPDCGGWRCRARAPWSAGAGRQSIRTARSRAACCCSTAWSRRRRPQRHPARGRAACRCREPGTAAGAVRPRPARARCPCRPRGRLPRRPPAPTPPGAGRLIRCD